MGVPAFFRWLSKKYPSVVAECVEERCRDYDGLFVCLFLFIFLVSRENVTNCSEVINENET